MAIVTRVSPVGHTVDHLSKHLWLLSFSKGAVSYLLRRRRYSPLPVTRTTQNRSAWLQPAAIICTVFSPHRFSWVLGKKIVYSYMLFIRRGCLSEEKKIPFDSSPVRPPFVDQWNEMNIGNNHNIIIIHLRPSSSSRWIIFSFCFNIIIVRVC